MAFDKRPVETISLSVHEIRIIINALDYLANDRLVYDPEHPFQLHEAERLLDKMVDLRDRTAAQPLPAFIRGRIDTNGRDENR